MPKYKDWLEDEKLTLIEGWARDGLTDEQIAHNMGIAYSTFYEWKKKYSEFSNVLKKGKEVTKDFFEDQSKIRGFIGFGFDKVRDRYQNDTTQLLSCKKMGSDEVRQGLLADIPGAYPFGVNNGIVELTNETGWGGYLNKLWGPYVFAREGSGRTPIVTYYNNSTKRFAVSYANDEYLIKKGYQAMGCIGAVKSDSKLK